MLLWQLAAPTLITVFLALVAIRGGVASSDAFSRFCDRAMAGRSGITVVVDSEMGGSISPALAEAALPIERLSELLQVPVHVRPADAGAFGLLHNSPFAQREAARVTIVSRGIGRRQSGRRW